MKKFESVEVTQGNTTGKAGAPSLPFNKGYYQSGNNGQFGVSFTPSSEPTFTNYKGMKHSKKNLRKKMRNFKEFVKEDVYYQEITPLEISFYDDNHKGFLIIDKNSKKQREHFRIYDYGNVTFDEFFSEETYEDLVKFVYENLPDGELKDSVSNYYIDIIEDTLTEDACATLGNTGGMGPVVSATPSSTPGDVAGSTPGSGDIGQSLFPTYMKPMLNLKKGRKKKSRGIKTFNNFSPN